MLRPVIKTLTLALFMALAMATVASATKVTVSDVPVGNSATILAGTKPPASVKLRTCRSAAYYDNRLIKFRARMSHFSDTNSPQKLQMRFDVYQRVNEAKKFKRLKADGLGVWTSSSDSAAVYQRDLVLTNVETAARYKARVAFRWIQADGSVEWHRTLTSTPCKQTAKLPWLRITKDNVVPVAGSTDLLHTFSIANEGGSEADSVEVMAATEGNALVTGTIDSIGPKQTVDLQLRVPACADQASGLPGGGMAYIDFQRKLRLTPPSWASFSLPRCK